MNQTSLSAFEAFKPQIPSDHKLILEVLSFNSNLTYREISSKLRWEHVKCARRMSELVRLEKVKISGVRICSIGKRSCSVYVLNNEK